MALWVLGGVEQILEPLGGNGQDPAGPLYQADLPAE